MAANDNLSEQFEDHKALMASVENAHDIEIDPMMGVRRGNGQPFPLADLHIFGTDRPTPNPGDKTRISLSGRIPHEDPERAERINLFASDAANKKGKHSGFVWTHETHGYPIPDSVSERNPEGQVHRVHRFTDHPDLDSADRHLRASGEARQKHLDDGTIPESGKGTPWEYSLSGPPTPTDRPMRPPNTMQYYVKGDTGERRTIDTGTRDIIPDKDQ